jgi:hypothetical protein
VPTPEHGPGQDRDEEEDGGIAGAHGRPRRFRYARTARATGPPAVHSADHTLTSNGAIPLIPWERSIALGDRSPIR